MTITIALLVEGASDTVGLRVLIERTVQQIVEHLGRYRADVFVAAVWDVSDKITFHSKGYAGCVVEAAQLAEGFSLLVLHRDADAPTTAKARRNYIKSAMDKVQAAKLAGNRVCNHIVPVIPIREMESWLLCDPAVLADVLDSTLAKLKEEGLPEHVHQVEAIPDPKQLFNQIVAATDPGADRAQLYGTLAERIELQRLGQLSAHQEFVAAVTEKLREQGLVA